jgi:hypothetical protein
MAKQVTQRHVVRALMYAHAYRRVNIAAYTAMMAALIM